MELTFPSCPEAETLPRVPGELLSVNEISLRACPALRIAFAASKFVRDTVICPADVVNAALADKDPSDPVPVPV